ncbi:MAG: acetyl-CoA C-acyltransferase, partial [Thermus sp.]|uniref:thiolase family protein n=1 Tax=Thermus sp. TaxID=275 RepID=UPI00332C1E60
MGEAVILGHAQAYLEAVRTPIGKRNGALREVRPDALYAHVLNALSVFAPRSNLRRTGIDPARIVASPSGERREDVVTGCVTQAGEQGANIGRLGVLLSDLPREVPAVSLNRMCGSSQQAIHFAAQAVAAGDMRYAIAGGVESMTRAPMFSDIRGGFETLNPALHKKYEPIHQGESAERIAERYGLTRRELDEDSYASHLKAARATKAGYFQGQIEPLKGLDPNGNPFTLSWDEGIRFEPDLERMFQL